ncbi:helix-turn-helix domain-containing protein [uncultured Aquimarina sp.]|uniref:helix-turn-helix domain-containing protein n=1 Tax=uncultured Aquimarina sp. TaxID=575652 RepID=UPI00261CE05E|nr:helix-turn-helix domain-containing protein [uncultured Aquimarina sp.]
MFGTQIHPITFTILLFQSIVLFAQLIFVLSRPNDPSRIRFLLLILAYAIFTLSSGLFSSEDLSESTIIPYILSVLSHIAFGVYFIYYIYEEFNIRPFKQFIFEVKSLLFILIGSFIVLFLMSYIVIGDLQLSRLLFLMVPLIMAFAFLYKLGNALRKLYRKGKRLTSRIFKYRIISTYVGLLSLAFLPILLVFSNDQCLKVSVVNFGFVLMMITYIIDFISQAQKEAIILAQISKKIEPIQGVIPIADDIIRDISEKLQHFEINQEYLERKTTSTSIAKKFGTNSKYLSKIVTINTGKSFPKYLNDLRINYVKNRLKEDEKFRNYTFKAIATEIGYTTGEGFARAFYKKEKIRLSEYIKNIRDNR